MGMREFLTFIAFLWMSKILGIASLICGKPKSKFDFCLLDVVQTCLTITAPVWLLCGSFVIS